MIKHIVLFQLKDIENKTEKCIEIKNALLALKGTVPELMQIEVGINENSKELYDISLSTVFASFEDLEAYAIHPEHLKAGKILKEVVNHRACVDYTIGDK